MAAEDSPEDFPEDDEDDLSRFQRILFGLVGGGAAYLGARAVFDTENEIGTGVMLALGGLFILIAVTGRPVASARLGENEFRFLRRARRNLAKRLQETESDEARVELAEAIIETDPTGDELVTVATGVLYEQAVWDALQRVFEREPDLGLEPRRMGSKDTGIDGMALDLAHQGPGVGIIIKRQVGTRMAVENAFLRVPELKRLLIVTQDAKSRPRLTDELRQRFPSRAIEIVVWRNSRHDGALRDAVEALITAAPDGRRPQ